MITRTSGVSPRGLGFVCVLRKNTPTKLPILSSLGLVLGCALSVLSMSACADKTRLHVENPDHTVYVQQRKVYPPDENLLPNQSNQNQNQNIRVNLGRDTTPVAYQLQEGSLYIDGVLPRTQIDSCALATGVGASACLMPTLALAGCALANPYLVLSAAILLPAPVLGVCAGGGTGLAWGTIPLVAGGCLLGAAPLVSGLQNWRVADDTSLSIPVGPWRNDDENLSNISSISGTSQPMAY